MRSRKPKCRSFSRFTAVEYYNVTTRTRPAGEKKLTNRNVDWEQWTGDFSWQQVTVCLKRKHKHDCSPSGYFGRRTLWADSVSQQMIEFPQRFAALRNLLDFQFCFELLLVFFNVINWFIWKTIAILCSQVTLWLVNNISFPVKSTGSSSLTVIRIKMLKRKLDLGIHNDDCCTLFVRYGCRGSFANTGKWYRYYKLLCLTQSVGSFLHTTAPVAIV